MFMCMQYFAFSQNSFSSTGGNASNQDGSISYSIGQVFVSQASSSKFSIAPGVQQPYEITILNGIEDVNLHVSLKTYPNPTVDILNISIDNLNDTIMLNLFSLNGKMIYDMQMTSKNSEIDMQNLSSGIYLLCATYKTSGIKFKTFKIIKN